MSPAMSKARGRLIWMPPFCQAPRCPDGQDRVAALYPAFGETLGFRPLALMVSADGHLVLESSY